MVTPNAYNKYQQNSVMTASPGDLTMMLFDGCLRFLKQSIHYFDKNDVVSAINNAHKSQKIIRELQDTLDLSIQLSDGLNSLYSFIDRHIAYAIREKDTKALKECVELVSELRDTWQGVLRESRKTAHQGLTVGSY